MENSLKSDKSEMALKHAKLEKITFYQFYRNKFT
jgi:hypothetical protein